jgi:diguanylate cyclase (GGDEF)-like protein
VVLAVLLGVLAVVSVAAVLDGSPDPFDLAQLALVTIILTVVAVQRSTAADAMRRRAVRDRTVSRILQGLSRSISPESVVDAVVDELRESSGADHVVVARQAEPDGTLEVTLVPSRGTVPASRTFLRPDILGDPAFATTPAPLRGGGPARGAPPALRFQEAADEVARRVRSGYGLPFTLSAPLVAEGRFVGALILSKRTRDSWTELDRRLLPWAAAEVSAAFSRAYALEAAEARANIDALTGLPNRRYLDEVVAITPPRRRAGDSLGALMIDIDRFKRLNDRYGHATGDAVLRDVAAAIYTTVRAEDTPARYGGEEFAVILRRASALQAADVAERIRAAVAAIPPERLGIAQPVTVSIGVAVADGSDDDVRSLLERADRALYEAKRRGRNRVDVG